MHEMNHGLRPNYDFDFDEAVKHLDENKTLKVSHINAIEKFTSKTTLEAVLANGQEIVIPQ